MHLAGLLLDFSRAAQIETVLALEAEPGYRGVAPASAEATFLLPGGFGWVA
ncbi:MAG: hypothetical protein IPG96_16660 [Proteobacteria bacterium]|nr:hypothetical protein [Pseudomonadota bacterium]